MNRLPLAGVTLGALVLLAGGALAGADGQALPEGARLMFSDDFERKDLGAGWQPVGGGNWEIRNGALFGQGNALVFGTRAVGSNLRVEYTAWTEDSPGDLSALLAASAEPRKKPILYFTPSYFAGFGSYNNSKNSITRNNVEIARTMMEGFTGGIQQGKRHRVVAQRQGGRVSLFVDGRLEVEIDDLFPPENLGDRFALYTWTSGYFDDVKVYALPAAPEPPAELPAVVTEHAGFDAEEVGRPPRSLEVSAGGAARVEVVDEPNWTYGADRESWVKDPCARLSGEGASLARTFRAIPSGIVEFDVRADRLGEGWRMGLWGSGKELAALVVGKDGVFMAETAKGLVKLNDRIEYRRRSVATSFRFEPGRWYTLRITYDAGARVVRSIAVVNMYTETKIANYSRGAADQGDYHVLGSDLPLEPGAGAADRVLFSLKGGGECLFDNLCVIGPVGRSLVRKQPILLPARTLLGLGYPMRKDPFHLSLYSLKGLEPKQEKLRVAYSGNSHATVRSPGAPEQKAFVPAAMRYNALLVRQAFATENRQMLERTAFHLENARQLTPGLAGRVRQAVAAEAETVAHLEKALQAYAHAYLNGLDPKELERSFAPAADRLEKSLDAAEKLASACLKELPGASLDPAFAEVPCPAPVSRSFPVWSKGTWRGADGEPDFHYYNRDRTDLPELLDLMGFPRRTHSVVNASMNAKPGEYATATVRRILESGVSRQFFHYLVGPSGLHASLTWVPQWWYEAHKGDADVFQCANNGAPIPPPISDTNTAFVTASLNFWNPEVQKLNREMYGELGRMAKESGRVLHLLLGQEAGNYVVGGFETGHNRSAVLAFQEFLKAEYRTIGALNQRWGTAHAAFEEIQPPVKPVEPCGVQYEFQRFRHVGYKEWLLSCKRAFQEQAPDIPAMNDFQHLMGGEDVGSFDMPSYFELGDIVAYHTYKYAGRSAANRWLDSLRKACGTTLDNGEWAAAQTTPEMFDENVYKRSGLAQVFHRMMWGQAGSSMWVGRMSEGEWVYSQTVTDPRLGYLVFRHHASYVPLVQDRARRFGRPALKEPSVAPDVGIVEATSSYYNALPFCAIRSGMRAVGIALEEKGHNFGVFYERLLLEQRQSLANVQTLVLPNAVCMPPALADMLLAWVKSGGTLIGFGPPGVFDSYGRPDSRFLRAAFGPAPWKSPSLGRWRPGGESPPTPAGTCGEVAFYRGSVGKGTVWVFDSATDYASALPAMLELVEKATVRTASCRENRFDLAMRGTGRSRLLYVLNASLRETREDDLVIRLPVASVTDRGLRRAVRVPTRTEGGATVLRMRLGPAEGTLLQLALDSGRD